MTYRWKVLAALGASAGLLMLTSVGCGRIASVDRDPIPEGGSSPTGGAGGTGGAVGGGGVGGTGGAVGGGGTGGACDPTSCPQGTDCQEPACDPDCVLNNLPAATPCTGTGGGAAAYCDDSGQCVWECLTEHPDIDPDCYSQACMNHACMITIDCHDGVLNGNETDVDCGGPDCPACADDSACLVFSDCQSGFCDATSTCADCTDDGDCQAGSFCDLTDLVSATDAWCIPLLPDGDPCDATDGHQCANGSCPADDQRCCDAACDGTCEACLGSKTGGTDGTCASVAAGTDPDDECNADPAGCEAADCNGAAASPGCAAAPSTVVCRPAAGVCDVEELCDGANLGCGPDLKAPSTTVCRPVADLCDAEEVCDGIGNDCPADGAASAGTVCRPLVHPACDTAETCDGSDITCPADATINEGGSCNNTLYCDGNTDTCAGGACLGSANPCTAPQACNESLDTCVANVWINEIHYDNISVDVDEGFEIAGPTGTNLAGWSVVLYCGCSTPYSTINLSGTIDDEENGYGAVWFGLPTGLSNGPADGLCLVAPGPSVVLFLTYEGVVTATDGPCAGLTSVDIGVLEDSTTAVGESLQLSGTGNRYLDFTWQAPQTNTRDIKNTGQTFTP